MQRLMRKGKQQPWERVTTTQPRRGRSMAGARQVQTQRWLESWRAKRPKKTRAVRVFCKTSVNRRPTNAPMTLRPIGIHQVGVGFKSMSREQGSGGSWSAISERHSHDSNASQPSHHIIRKTPPHSLHWGIRGLLPAPALHNNVPFIFSRCSPRKLSKLDHGSLNHSRIGKRKATV
jgi:hypothetical protein